MIHHISSSTLLITLAIFVSTIAQLASLPFTLTHRTHQTFTPLLSLRSGSISSPSLSTNSSSSSTTATTTTDVNEVVSRFKDEVQKLRSKGIEELREEIRVKTSITKFESGDDEDSGVIEKIDEVDADESILSIEHVDDEIEEAEADEDDDDDDYTNEKLSPEEEESIPVVDVDGYKDLIEQIKARFKDNDEEEGLEHSNGNSDKEDEVNDEGSNGVGVEVVTLDDEDNEFALKSALQPVTEVEAKPKLSKKIKLSPSKKEKKAFVNEIPSNGSGTAPSSAASTSFSSTTSTLMSSEKLSIIKTLSMYITAILNVITSDVCQLFYVWFIISYVFG